MQQKLFHCSAIVYNYFNSASTKKNKKISKGISNNMIKLKYKNKKSEKKLKIESALRNDAREFFTRNLII
jgi:hypothetical protein